MVIQLTFRTFSSLAVETVALFPAGPGPVRLAKNRYVLPCYMERKRGWVTSLWLHGSGLLLLATCIELTRALNRECSMGWVSEIYRGHGGVALRYSSWGSYHW